MKISRFVKELKIGKGRYLFHTLTLELLKIMSDEGSLDLSSLTQSQLRTLKRCRIIVPSEEADSDFLALLRKKYVDIKYVKSLFFLLTDRCNFGCSYCFIRNSMKKNYRCSSMDFETAKAAIGIFLKTVLRNESSEILEQTPYSIFFFGGEPLLNRVVFQEILSYFEKVRSKFPKEVQLNLITNGSIIDDSLISSIKEHNVAVGISLDGSREIHNLYRKDRRGRGTFDKVLDTIKRLRDAEIDVGISCTILQHNVDKMLEFSEWLYNEYGIYSFGFNSLLDTDDFSADLNLVKRYSNNIVNHFRMARDKGIQDDVFLKRYKTFLGQRLLPYNCAAPGRQLVVSPSGKIGLCHEGTGLDKFFFGNVRDEKFDYWASPLVKEWQKRSPLYMKECQKCLALGLCGGGCLYTSFLKFGTIWERDNNFCVFARKMVRSILEEAVNFV